VRCVEGPEDSRSLHGTDITMMKHHLRRSLATVSAAGLLAVGAVACEGDIDDLENVDTDDVQDGIDDLQDDAEDGLEDLQDELGDDDEADS
jgi:hypothetical protein